MLPLSILKPMHFTINNWSAERGLVTPSLEARYPLEAAVVDAPAGRLPPTQAGLALSRKGVMLTAFGPNPDGAGTLLRLWEYTGLSGVCQVRLPTGLRAQRIQPVDLRGRPLRVTRTRPGSEPRRPPPSFRACDRDHRNG